MDNKFNNGIVGFLMGFFLGCIGLVIALIIGGPSTKKGAVGGFVTAMLMGLCLGSVATILQIALNA